MTDTVNNLKENFEDEIMDVGVSGETIPIKNGEVLDIEVMSRYCKTCKSIICQKHIPSQPGKTFSCLHKISW